MKYRNVQIPEILIENAYLLFSHFGYRTHHEFIIEAIRIRIETLIKRQYRLEILKEKTSHIKEEKTKESDSTGQE